MRIKEPAGVSRPAGPGCEQPTGTSGAGKGDVSPPACLTRACVLVRCTADRGGAGGVEPGGPGAPGLGEHPGGPAGVQRSQPGDPRCEQPGGAP